MNNQRDRSTHAWVAERTARREYGGQYLHAKQLAAVRHHSFSLLRITTLFHSFICVVFSLHFMGGRILVFLNSSELTDLLAVKSFRLLTDQSVPLKCSLNYLRASSQRFPRLNSMITMCKDSKCFKYSTVEIIDFQIYVVWTLLSAVRSFRFSKRCC